MLDYTTHGDPNRPALTLLHSGGMTRQEWDPFLDRFSEQFYLIVPSALGHGASPPVESLTISSMANALLELLDDLSIQQSHLLGSSMGAAIALWVAMTTPERVNKLIVFRTSYHSTPKVYKGVAAMANREAWEQWRLDQWMSEQHEPQGGPDAWLEVTRKVADAFDPETTDHKHDLGDLATIDHPTLLITGDRDPVVPLDDMVDMYRTIPNAALWVMPNANHFMGTDSWRQDAFEQEIIRFLRRS